MAGVATEPVLKDHLTRLADALDADPRQLMTRTRRAAQAKDVEALKRLAAEVQADVAPPAILIRLGGELKKAQCLTEAERLFRVGQLRYPSDFWMNLQLALTLRYLGPTKVTEAIRYFSIALSLRPRSLMVWNQMWLILMKAKRFEEAEAHARRAIAQHPDYALHYCRLGEAIAKQGQHRDAEVVAAYRQALALNPDFDQAYGNLFLLAESRGRFEEVEATFRHEIARRPETAAAHHWLGAVLGTQGRLAEAEASCRHAIKLNPRLAKAHLSLGIALNALGRHQEALAEFIEADALEPSGGMAQFNLGLALRDHKRFAEAETAFRRHIDVIPDYQPAHAQLGFVLFQQGRTTQALAAYQRAVSLTPHGADPTRNVVRYNAACAFALAGCGQGKGTAELNASERAHLRQQAHDWLIADLADLAKLADQPTKRRDLQKTMQHWQKDPDFAGVRGETALAKLPEAERAAWQKLWADVANLLKRTDEPKPPGGSPPKP
jgi:tetratricopeptide (TPR) repeat protein